MQFVLKIVYRFLKILEYTLLLVLGRLRAGQLLSTYVRFRLQHAGIDQDESGLV